MAFSVQEYNFFSGIFFLLVFFWPNLGYFFWKGKFIYANVLFISNTNNLMESEWE
jgi:hypothetical protein